jgi:FKBP-type peptidyl-prolyl cis-trans isomerase
MMQHLLKIVGLFVILLSVSCSSDKYPGFEKGKNDVYYKVHHRGNDTTHPGLDDFVVVEMDYGLADSVLFSSKNLDKPLRFLMIEPMFRGDLYEGIKLMSIGDSMSFAVVADSFYIKTAKFKNVPDFIVPGSPMYYHVKLTNILSEEEFKLELEKERDSLRNLEKEILANYIAKNNITVQPKQSGLYFIPIEPGKGKKPDTGDMCQVVMEVKQIDGKLLFSNLDTRPMDVEFGKNFDTKGFMEGLSMLRVGGKAQLIVPSEIGVGEKGRELVPPFTTILYEIELQKIKTVAEVRRERAERKKALAAESQRFKEAESAKIDAYIKKNNIKEKPTGTGLYYIEIEEGSGEHPVKGETVVVHYIASRTDGFLIQDSYKLDQPAIFIIGQGMVFAGWEEAVLLMKKGGKAKIIVPSSLAYRERGNGAEVGPYEPLVFELELLEDK